MIGLTLHFRLRMCCSFNYAIYFHLSVLPLPPTKLFFLNKRTEGAIENNYWGGGPQCFPWRLAFFLTSRTTVRLILCSRRNDHSHKKKKKIASRGGGGGDFYVECLLMIFSEKNRSLRKRERVGGIWEAGEELLGGGSMFVPKLRQARNYRKQILK